MTQRERRLRLFAGGIFAVFLIYIIVQRLVIGSILDKRTKITTLRNDQQQLLRQADAEERYRRLWTQLSSRTLAGDAPAAKGKLDRLIKSLLKESGLQHFTVNPGDVKPSKDKLYAVIPYTVVGAEGEMQAFARFLHSFYQQPYAMQITGFNIEPLSFRKSSTLRVSSLVIEALVLPTEGLPGTLVSAAQPTATGPAATQPTVAGSPTTRPTVAGSPTTQPRLTGPATRPVGASPAMLVSASTPPAASAPLVPGRPKGADLQAYAVVWEKKFMEEFKEPPPPKPEPAKPTPPPVPPVAMPTINPAGGQFTGPMEVRITCSTPSTTIRYTTDGTEPNPSSGQVYSGPVHLEAAGMIKAIAYITTDNRASSVSIATFTVPPPPPMKLFMLDPALGEAVVLNEQTKERQILQKGDSLDGGTLVLLLPYAAIVETPENLRYIYWNGKGFKDKEILDENRQPEVWNEVKELEDSGQ